eukprot:6199270-Pleurochrysis_carterae.AAC.5
MLPSTLTSVFMHANRLRLRHGAAYRACAAIAPLIASVEVIGALVSASCGLLRRNPLAAAAAAPRGSHRQEAAIVIKDDARTELGSRSNQRRWPFDELAFTYSSYKIYAGHST